MKKTNAAKNLATAENLATGKAANMSADEKAATVAATVQSKPKTAAELFAAALVTKSLSATVKDGHEVRTKLTNEQLIALVEKEAPLFKEMGEMGEKELSMSSDRYETWSPVFPVRIGLNGEPDVAEFMQRIYQMLDDSMKTPHPTKAGSFAACQTAARDRNQYARGIVSMGRWVTRNKATLFAHLGVKAVDDDTKAAQAVEGAIKKIDEFTKELHGFKFHMLDSANQPIVGDDGSPKIMGIREILTAVNDALVKPLLDAKKAEKKDFREKMEADRAKETEEPAVTAAQKEKQDEANTANK